MVEHRQHKPHMQWPNTHFQRRKIFQSVRTGIKHRTVLLSFRGAQGAHFQLHSYPLSVSLLFLEAHKAHNCEPVTAPSLSCFISEVHKAHTSNSIPTLSLSHFLLEAHKAHNREPVTALSFVLLYFRGAHFQLHSYPLSVSLLFRGAQGTQLWTYFCPLFCLALFQRRTLPTPFLPSLCLDSF